MKYRNPWPNSRPLKNFINQGVKTVQNFAKMSIAVNWGLFYNLQGKMMTGDLRTGGLNAFRACSIKGLFVSSKLSNAIPNAHLAMTSIVNALNSLERKSFFGNIIEKLQNECTFSLQFFPLSSQLFRISLLSDLRILWSMSTSKIKCLSNAIFNNLSNWHAYSFDFASSKGRRDGWTHLFPLLVFDHRDHFPEVFIVRIETL